MSGVDDALGTLYGRLDYPMFVVTTSDGSERSGCLVGFTTQCSVSPALFAIAISNKNHTHVVLQRATHVGVHVVPRDAEELARLFGEETGDEIDKFERCAWSEGEHAVPLLEACSDRFVATIEERVESGDHTLFLVSPVHVDVGDERPAYTFQSAKEMEPGHEA